MKVLIADRFEQSGIDGLKAADCEVVYQPDLKDKALASAIRDGGADAMVLMVALAETAGDERARNWAASLYNNLGWTYHDQGRYAEALQMFEKASPSPSARRRSATEGMNCGRPVAPAQLPFRRQRGTP